MAKERHVIDSYNITGENLRNVGNHYHITNVEVHSGEFSPFFVLLV